MFIFKDVHNQKVTARCSSARLEAGYGVTSTPVETPVLPRVVDVDMVLLPKLDDSGS